MAAVVWGWASSSGREAGRRGGSAPSPKSGRTTMRPAPGSTQRSGPDGPTPARPRGSRRTTAQVTIGARPRGADFRFGTRSSPPAASAAASATDGVPTAASGAPDGPGTSIRASSPAGYVRSGTPSAAAAATMPGSSALVSTVTSSATLDGESPAPCRVSRISPRISSTGAPLDAPTPTASDAGGGTAAESTASDMGRGPFGTREKAGEEERAAGDGQRGGLQRLATGAR